jgi:phage/plasmid-associated DNA primase
MFGLERPKIVTDATDAYIEAQDTVRQWVEDRCIVHRHATALTTNADLYQSFKQYAEINGCEFVLRKNDLLDALEQIEFRDSAGTFQLKGGRNGRTRFHPNRHR